MKTLRLTFQILGLISVASFAGAMLMLYTALVPFWKQVPPAEFIEWFSNFSSGIQLTTGLLGFASIIFPIASVFLVWKVHKSRLYWILSSVLVIGIMIITFAFFLDANSSFANKTIELNEVANTLNTWGNLHFIRIILGFGSALFAAFGFTNFIGIGSRDNSGNQTLPH